MVQIAPLFGKPKYVSRKYVSEATNEEGEDMTIVVVGRPGEAKVHDTTNTGEIFEGFSATYITVHIDVCTYCTWVDLPSRNEST